MSSKGQSFEALALLASESKIKDALGEIVSIYGKVNSISRLSPRIKLGSTIKLPPGECKFLVNYEDTMDAMTAASELHCPMFGFSTLVVSVPQNGKFAY